MPLISALPAMPSPIPAPIAPPPRASPPPMRPPAVATACVMSFAAMFVSLLRGREVGRVSRKLVLFGGGEAEVEDGQERVDEGLDRRDEAGVEDAPDEVAETVEREQVEGQQPDHRQHDRAGEDVAEEPQRQRERVDDLLQQQDERADADRLGPEPVRDVSPALPLD